MSRIDPQMEVDKALDVLARIDEVTLSPHARADLPKLFRDLGIHIGLSFVAGTKGKKPVVRRLASGRRVGCRESRTRTDWALEVRRLLEVDYPQAEVVTLVCDNLNTHDVASLYFAFDAATAHRLARRLRIVYTPKNGSWLNMAEMELSLLSRQCLGTRRFGAAKAMDEAISAWQTDRNARHCGANWRFTTAGARIKLKSLYPTPDIER